MMSRVERHGSDSDSALFTELLYAGEFILKSSVSILIAAIEDDREKHQYRLMHNLVRADGLGEWSRAFDEALTGPAATCLSSSIANERRAFTERTDRNAWQYRAVESLNEVLSIVGGDRKLLAEKIALRAWFPIFAELRNKSRGHGAVTPATCAACVPYLKESIYLLVENNPLFFLPSAYLDRNLSGKYRVVRLAGAREPFEPLTTAAAANKQQFEDGIYVYLGSYKRVHLILADLDCADFFFPNGAFKEVSHELHSLITDSRRKGDSIPYLAPSTEKPASETEGKGELDIVGRTFTNIPFVISNYITRTSLEKDVKAALVNDRHPIITLVGRGGIGKTSLALRVLGEIAQTDRYQLIVWFSARDIDLMLSGAKQVRPQVLTDEEIAEAYCHLVGVNLGDKQRRQKALQTLAEHLRCSSLAPTLFVFDNFETVRSPVDLFNWIDLNIRLPNKVMITSRFRDFKADYPIEISGMESSEAQALITQACITLSIEDKIGPQEREQLIEDSDGHPYVIKIILGEVANSGKFEKPSKLIARKEDILDALFERTFASLSPMAARIFLMLVGWRSLVPQLAAEAVLFRHGGEQGNPGSNIDRLVRTSLIDRISAGDQMDFLEVPLTAALFGRRKLEVSPIRAVIEGDTKFLQDIGASKSSALKEGIRPRLETFFRRTGRKIVEGKTSLDDVRPILEFLARGYSPAWIMLSDLEQEINGRINTEKAVEYIRLYLETHPEPEMAAKAWQKLVYLYRLSQNVIAGCDAFLRAAETSDPPLDEVSEIANWLNNSDALKDTLDVEDRKPLCSPLSRLMEQKIGECSATDLSRLAWLYLHSGETARARDLADLGLRREPSNIYCGRLVTRLENQ